MSKTVKTLLFVGQARLPKGISESERVQVVMEIDPGTKKVLDAGCIPCHPLVERVLKEILIGMRMNEEEEVARVFEEVSTRLHSRVTRAITTALHDICRRYQERVPPGASE